MPNSHELHTVRISQLNFEQERALFDIIHHLLSHEGKFAAHYFMNANSNHTVYTVNHLGQPVITINFDHEAITVKNHQNDKIIEIVKDGGSYKSKFVCFNDGTESIELSHKFVDLLNHPYFDPREVPSDIQYICDVEGNKTAVIISIEEYRQLVNRAINDNGENKSSDMNPLLPINENQWKLIALAKNNVTIIENGIARDANYKDVLKQPIPIDDKTRFMRLEDIVNMVGPTDAELLSSVREFYQKNRQS